MIAKKKRDKRLNIRNINSSFQLNNDAAVLDSGTAGAELSGQTMILYVHGYDNA